MGRIIKRYFVICILMVLLTDAAIGYLLFKSRAFSHSAIWHIIESNKQKYFYRQPEDAPGYFRFEPYSDKIAIFREEILPLVRNESDEFKIALQAAKHLMDLSSNNSQFGLSLQWDSPEGLLRQIRKGAAANCFDRSILFSTYLSSLGIKSRLWALENEGFNGIAHSITEVYIKSLKKWVFIDVTFGFYITENGRPLSLLELREKLLNGSTDNILVQDVISGTNKSNKLPLFYSRLVKCVFLRADNDFVNKFNNRYGVFSIFQKYLDKFPNNIRRGLDYLLGRQAIFAHYVDTFSGSLKAKIIAAKLLFYFFMVSLAFIGILLAMLFLSFLKHRLLINLSKKDTRHR